MRRAQREPATRAGRDIKKTRFGDEAASRRSISGGEPMNSTREQLSEAVVLGRRRFVQGVTAVLSGVLLGLGRAWAIELHAFSAEQSATLLAMIHTIAPHDGLDEAAYALVASALDADATASAETRGLLSAGLAGLGPDFARAP
jgi:hypothetical protein